MRNYGIWSKIWPSMHHTHSCEHSVSPRSFATKSSIYHPNVVRGGENQQHIQPQNFVGGFWQDKTECQTGTTRFNSRAIGGLFCNWCWPFGNCKQGQHILLFHHRRTRSAAWRGTNTPDSNEPRAQPSRTKTTSIPFFNWRGVVHKEFNPLGQTVNQDI